MSGVQLKFALSMFMCVTIVSLCKGHNITEVQALREYLFDNSNYNRHVRPAVNQSKPTKVYVCIN